MPQTVRAEYAGCSDVGRERQTNEDQFLIADLSRSLLVQKTSLSYEDQTRLLSHPQGSLLVVADGMGGQAAGDRASSLAVGTITHYILNTMPWFFRLDQLREEELREALIKALRRSHEAVRADSERAPERRGMGTTLTMGYVLWPRLYVLHAGDSRCYLLRDSQLVQLTRDHSYAQQLVERGELDPQQAEQSRLSHILWNAIVADDRSELHPEVYRAELAPGESLLLCSDGLTKHLQDHEIAGVLLDAPTAEGACQQLVQLANNRGGSDNITVVVARFSAGQ